MKLSFFVCCSLTCLSVTFSGWPGCYAETAGPPASVSSVAGTNGMSGSRPCRRLEESELRDLLTATLQRELVRGAGELELRLGRSWGPLVVPEGPLAIKLVELPLNGLAPNFILRFELRCGDNSLGSWQLPLQAHIWRELWVARSTQVRGRLLAEADFGPERRDLLLCRDALLSVDFTNEALELAETLPAGAPLLARSVRLRPVVRRGKVLEALVQDGLLSISSRVEALEDGVPGQTIRVRNTQSKRELRGKVQNEQTIIVSL